MHRAVHTGADLREWRLRLGWTAANAGLWWGCTDTSWQKWERLDYLPLPLINRIHEFEWVRHQGYSPTRTIAGRPKAVSSPPDLQHLRPEPRPNRAKTAKGDF